MKPPLHRPPSGHTLLEILLALGLSLILLTAVYAALDLHWRYSLAGEVETERSQIARAVAQQFSRDVQSAIPGSSSHAAGGLSGDDRELCLQLWETELLGSEDATAGRPTAQPGPLSTVCWRIRELDEEQPAAKVRSANRSGLVREYLTRDRNGESSVDDNGLSEADLVAEEVKSIRFSYFDGQRWHTQWDSQQAGRLPRAVEINIRFDDDEEGAAEPIRATEAGRQYRLVVAPRYSAEGGSGR